MPVLNKSEILEYLEGNVFPHLYHLMYRRIGEGFAEGTREKYVEHMKALFDHLRNALPRMDEETKDPAGLKLFLSSEEDSKASFSKIFKDFHDIYTVLKSGMTDREKGLNFRPNGTVFQLMFCLSDALTEYISILKTHPRVNVQALTESLNEGDNWMVLFHCVVGRPTPENEPKAASEFLTYDFNFKESLQQSGRIEEIHSALDRESDNCRLRLVHSSYYTYSKLIR